MHSIVETRLSPLRDLCREYRVARLDLFGSAVGESFDPERSDLDFLVEYLPHTGADPLEEFFGFKAALEALFARKVDLVEAPAIRNNRAVGHIHK